MLNKWKSKTFAQKKLFFEAYFYIIYCQILIKIFPFKKIIRLNRLEDIKDSLETLSDSEYVSDIKWAIQAASRYSLFKPLCLNQALAAQKMLQRRNLHGTLFLGVGKDDKEENKMVAHAWLKYNDSVITGAGGIEKYSVVAKYSWK